MILTNHAQEQMAKRGVTRKDIELALNRPIGVPLPADLGKIRIDGYATNNRVLAVIVPAVSVETVIVTVFWP